jgi:hypothetical protein
LLAGLRVSSYSGEDTMLLSSEPAEKVHREKMYRPIIQE